MGVDFVVHVPATEIELDKPHTAFYQSAGQQAVVGERSGPGTSAVSVVRVLRLPGDVHQLGDACLHPIRELKGVDASFDLGVSDDLKASLVEGVDAFDQLATSFRIDALRVGKEEHRIALRLELHALVTAGEETTVVETRKNRLAFGPSEEYDEIGQVPVQTAQSP